MTEVDDSEYDQIKYQLFYEIKNKELYSIVYPVCIEACFAKGHDETKILTHQQLMCAENCLQKYKSSFNLAMGLLTLKDKWLS